MFGHGETYQGLGSTSGMSGASGFEVSTSLGSGFRSSGSSAYSNNSSRVSDQTYRGFASGVMTTRSERVIGSVSREGSTFITVTPRGNGSFLKLHNQIKMNLNPEDLLVDEPSYVSEGSSSTGRPTNGATGELDPSYASPIGDVVLPMLLIVTAYVVVRFFKNLKLKHSAK